jgi:hypothetical protein
MSNTNAGPHELYVWFAENRGSERDGELFIRAWTSDADRVSNLQIAIGRPPEKFTTQPIETNTQVADALEALMQDIEDLKHDNASMLDSLTKESVARCEAEDALAALTLENQRLRVDAERYRWATATEDNASTLHSILLCHAGDQAKIDERVDEYVKGGS